LHGYVRADKPDKRAVRLNYSVVPALLL
jgi:hypothetical protein